MAYQKDGRATVEDRPAQAAVGAPGASPDVPTQYLIGVAEGAPFQNVAVGGFGFPAYTEDRVLKNGATLSTRRPGVIVSLTRAEIAVIRDRAAAKMLRGGKRNMIVSKDSRYRAQPFDVPLSSILYMVPAPAPGTILMQAPPAGTGF